MRSEEVSNPTLDLLVIADLHYASVPERRSPIADRIGWFGPLMIRKALWRLKHEGIKPDLVILLGDLLESPDRGDLEAIRDEIAQAGIPVIALKGNHDDDLGLYKDVFGTECGLHEFRGYGFLVFSDNYGPGDAVTREPSALNAPIEAAKLKPDLPIVALQHNPIYPDIESGYPYTPANAEAIRRSYEEAGVVLSLSGHYHHGQPISSSNGVSYHTVAASGQSPFAFSHISLSGRNVEVHPHQLKMDLADLWDTHCHTQFAYCATTSEAPLSIELSELLGVSGMCVVEHAFHLYYGEDDAWSYRWQRDRDLARAAGKLEASRIHSYRRFVSALRESNARRGIEMRFGLEVDLCTDGSLLLAEEDHHGWDLFVGAIHRIQDVNAETSTKEAERRFLKDVECLLRHPIQILAHPFRWFRRAKREIPSHLFAPVAEMLARRGVAAEVNFHTNQPSADFTRACVLRGVKIALGSDTHEIEEAGEFHPHFRLLQEAGVTRDQLSEVLYRPPQSTGVFATNNRE